MRTLVITDVQHDFMPGGALGVPHASEIIPVINGLILQFDHIVATMDWHPPHHVSFAKTHGKTAGDVIKVGGINQILWPVHCVQGTHGANFATGLQQKRIEAVFHKGTDPNVDSYSAFFDNARHRSTGLDEYLRKHKLSDLWFVGVATDYCILYSAIDALQLEYKVTVIKSACRAINLHPGDEQKAFDKMQAKGASIHE